MHKTNLQGRSAGKGLSALLVSAVALTTLLAPATALAQDQPVDPVPTLFDYVPSSRIQADPDDAAQVAGDAQTGTASAAEALAPEALSPEALSPEALSKATYMPFVFQEHTPRIAERMGYGAASRKISEYPQIRSLRAGWYVDWGVRRTPIRPGGIEYAQMVRMHQKLTCPIGTTADRTICPYVSPPAYELSVSTDEIKEVARRNHGALWLLGNEMDRVDWEGGRQDEMTPQLYAVAYHDLYTLIKAEDPTARIAIGGVIQFTPLRQQYLETVLDTYQQKYGTAMPIDVWNIHNFVGSEFCRMEKVNNVNTRRCYGMGIPAGIDVAFNAKQEQRGAYVGEDWRHTDIGTFAAQMQNMRQWMHSKGYGNKPLIVSEYGVLYSSLCFTGESLATCKNRLGSHYVDLTNPTVVQDFMISTFEYFIFAKNSAVSLVDGGRLVQRWAWFGLEDIEWAFNEHGALMDKNTRLFTTAGQRYADFTANNWQHLQMD